MSDKRWDGLTISGTLPIGVLYAGTRHRDYTLRVPLAGDLVDAQEAHPQGLVRLVALDLYRRQLLQLGEIPAEAITLELLRSELTEIDMAELERADAELGKRFAPPRPGSSTGAASSTPSSVTATPSPTSGA
ncbi:hypothetical protein [Mizugakiibacter sediminis]|uniref:hypothetical protein n=1 Tax=Mizugakiibacter sediminis TaxID=1475481 RepID=UPI000785C9F6|nr:hypothetical protein [Mizugakiibacter sediminis]